MKRDVLHEQVGTGAVRPVNATAARVVGSGPKGLESHKLIEQVCSAVPLPTRRVPYFMPQLLGARRGKLTVVGLCAQSRKDGAQWLCRCVCGYYVTRATKAIRNERNDCDSCDRCRQVAFLRRASTYRQTGADD